MNIPFKPSSVNGKVVAITGAGGVICGAMAKALGACGAKVAVLDLQLDKAEAVAQEIRDAGGVAKGYEANVLDKEDLAKAHNEINKDLGLIDILINGAGGNSPKATTTQEYYEPTDAEGVISFFDLKKDDIERNGAVIKVASSTPNVLEEYFVSHPLVELGDAPRLIIHE